MLWMKQGVFSGSIDIIIMSIYIEDIYNGFI